MTRFLDHPFEPLLNKLKISEKPLLVKVLPERNCKEDEPFNNVIAKVSKRGGDPIVGWQLIETNLTFEAHYHSVYRSPNGYMVDITPGSWDTIAFVPTNDFEYNGRFRIRINNGSNPLVNNFIHLLDVEDDFRSKKADMNGKLSFEDSLKLKLMHQVGEAIIESVENEKTLCFCGRRKPFTQCHLLRLDNFIEAVISDLTLLEYKAIHGTVFDYFPAKIKKVEKVKVPLF